MDGKGANPEQLLARIAAGQHGVVTTAQLGKVGITENSIRRGVVAARLHRLHRGVYAVGHPAISFEGRCLAAVLALGEGAVLSHRSAAELWNILPRATGPIHVTLPSDAGRKRRKGLIIHRSRTLGPQSTAFTAGVRATTAARTLTDLRPGIGRELHDRATRRALDLGLISRDPAISDTALTRSELERTFIRLLRRHRLPQPVVNARIGRYEVDFLWREQRLVVETDGFRYHGTRDAFERDRKRDADLQARGYRVLRVTHKQLRDSPRKVARSVNGLLGAALRSA
jgi:very-short-patch-repair endonuclease